MNCSVCSKNITGNYCSNCGQWYNSRRVSLSHLLGDLSDSIFSLEKSFLMNMRAGLLQPSMLVLNYWNGFRRYYYGPGKFFALASLFLVFHYAFVNDFLGIVITSTISSQFVILFGNISLMTLSSWFIYLRFKRNIIEHLILNLYNVSLWTMIFTPLSIILSIVMNNNDIERYFHVVLHTLIILWNSKAFKLTKAQRSIAVMINVIFVYSILFAIVHNYGEF
jgi:hypothetical protein